MSNPFVQATPKELLTALENAGRAPSLDLIRACLSQQQELVPDLLQMLGGGVDENWRPDDPRWYRELHAGHLLIAYQEPQAIPLFVKLLADPDRDDLLDWFENALPHYGALLIQPMLELIQNDAVWDWGRIAAVEILATIGAQHPETRNEIVAGLRDELPVLDNDGNLILPPHAPDSPPELWTFVALALADLNDDESRAHIQALYQAELIDESVMGDYDDYLEILNSRTPKQRRQIKFDILQEYSNSKVSEWKPELDALIDLSPNLLIPQPAPMPFVRAQPKIGRNDPCYCGSGKKFKHCHGK